MSISKMVESAHDRHPDCRIVLQLLDGLGENDPDQATLARLAEHFERCSRCTNAEASIEELIALYRDQASAVLPSGMADRLLDCMCD